VDPVYVKQIKIAVTILHKIHYSIEVPKTKTDYWFSKYNRVLHHYSVGIAAAAVVALVAAC
jgi:G:T-mismatch repair DNA endonuclease (very short patch repair protein)